MSTSVTRHPSAAFLTAKTPVLFGKVGFTRLVLVRDELLPGGPALT